MGMAEMERRISEGGAGEAPPMPTPAKPAGFSYQVSRPPWYYLDLPIVA